MKALHFAAALGATVLSALPAAAGVYSPAGVTAEEVAAVIQARQMTAKITTDDSGDPMVESASDGITWRVYFYDCTEGRCTSIQFSAGYDLDNGLPLEKANAWNFNKRFGRAALDEEMDPFVRYDIDVAKGYTSESMDDALATWLLVIPAFTTFIEF